MIAGLFQGINTPTVLDAALSGLTSTLIILSLIVLWKRVGGEKYSLRNLLPTQGEFRVLLIILLFYYGFMGVFWRPEALPGIVPQAAVWSLYLIFGVLLALGLRKSNIDTTMNTEDNLFIRIRNMFYFGVIFSLCAVLGKATGLSIIAVYLVWFGGIIFGLYTFVKVIILLR